MSLKNSKSSAFSKSVKEISKSKIKRDENRTKIVIFKHLLLILIISLMFTFMAFALASVFFESKMSVFSPWMFVVLMCAFVLCGAFTFKPYGLLNYFKAEGEDAVVQIPTDILNAMLESDKYKAYKTELIGVIYENKDDESLFDNCRLYETTNDFAMAMNKLIEYIYGDVEGISIGFNDSKESVRLMAEKKHNSISSYSKLDFYFIKFVNHYFRYLPNGKIAFLDVDFFIKNTTKCQYENCSMQDMTLEDVFINVGRS